MRLSRTAAVLALYAGSTLPVIAETTPLPVYDVEAACRRAGFGVPACIQYVQPAYDHLAAIWPALDEGTKRTCVARFPENIHARYVQIDGCVSAAESAQFRKGAEQAPPRFRY